MHSNPFDAIVVVVGITMKATVDLTAEVDIALSREDSIAVLDQKK